MEGKTERHRKSPRASVGSWAGLACTGIDWARDPAHSTLHAPEPGQAIGLGAGTKLEAIMAFLTTENKSLAHLKRDGGEGAVPEKTDKQNRTSPKTSGQEHEYRNVDCFQK